jgi:copper resistance protein B
MMKRLLLPVALGFSTTALAMGMEDDPLIGMLKIDQLEVRDTEAGNATAWKADAWLGKDLRKLWLKTEGEYLDGETEEAELQLLYSQAVSPYWDVQAGWRRDLRPTPTRDWLALGIMGLAPYLFEVDAALFVGEEGRGAARLDAEYEYLFSQRLVLTPELEANLYSKADPERGIGAGLSDLSLGLRLRYEIRREFAPYIGVHWTGLYGDTADYAEAAGGDSSEAVWVAGIRAWF